MKKIITFDIQESEPPVYIKINRVGVKGVKKTIIRKKNGRYTVLHGAIDVFIDLPETKKGIHMSRNLEVVNEIIESATERKIEDAEVLCIEIAKKILEKQTTATSAEVIINAEYTLPRKTPVLHLQTQEKYELTAKALAWREGNKIKIRRSIGAGVEGLTVCPCSIEAVREYVSKNYNIDKNTLVHLPLASHNQRGKGTLIVETDEDYRVEADELIAIIENSMSSPIYEVLKREDELKVVLDAHKKPRFAEDVLRLMIKGLVQKYPTLPGSSYIIAMQENYESIHRHNVFAERTGFFSEIKKEMKENGNANKKNKRQLRR